MFQKNREESLIYQIPAIGFKNSLQTHFVSILLINPFQERPCLWNALSGCRMPTEGWFNITFKKMQRIVRLDHRSSDNVFCSALLLFQVAKTWPDFPLCLWLLLGDTGKSRSVINMFILSDIFTDSEQLNKIHPRRFPGPCHLLHPPFTSAGETVRKYRFIVFHSKCLIAQLQRGTQ